MLNLPVKNRGKTVEAIACDKCNCTWLYPVQVNRYLPTTQPLTMPAPTIHFDSDFHVLVCAGCGNVVFPPVEAYQTASISHQLYNEMVEEIAGSKDKATERLQAKVKNMQAKATWDHIPDKRLEEKKSGNTG